MPSGRSSGHWQAALSPHLLLQHAKLLAGCDGCSLRAAQALAGAQLVQCGGHIDCVEAGPVVPHDLQDGLCAAGWEVG
jgi:hypothetical protein